MSVGHVPEDVMHRYVSLIATHKQVRKQNCTTPSSAGFQILMKLYMNKQQLFMLAGIAAGTSLEQ